ncbi:MAG: lipoyl synthase [Candidatus Omnitrophica bacterium]|nr:lipoyl synthase [Candidatus Omnitrophota bacterium]
MMRLPAWFRQDIPDESTFKIARLFSEFRLHTVCQKARCPNTSRCFKDKKFTFMILGPTCSRNCGFCGVDKSKAASFSVDNDEPDRIARVAQILGLSYAVITSVTRDDLPDGGASRFAETIESIHALDKDIEIEVLIPDFQGKISSLERVLKAGPAVVAHNIETVRRLYPELRPWAGYQLSLNILSKIKELSSHIYTKSSIILGLGEAKEEVIATMEDLREHSCDILTLGQYLAPSVKHYPVKEFISIEQFQEYQDRGISMGFKAVLSGPKVRSSYQAQEIYKECFDCAQHPERAKPLCGVRSASPEHIEGRSESKDFLYV